MPIVKMDDKGRIQLPHELREAWKLRPRQSLIVELHGESAKVNKLRRLQPEQDQIIKEFTEHPLRGGKLDKKILDALEETMWLP